MLPASRVDHDTVINGFSYADKGPEDFKIAIDICIAPLLAQLA